jgi:hypothetical protein
LEKFLISASCRGNGCSRQALLVLLEGSHEGHLVLRGLEATVTELGTGVNELEVDLLESATLSVHQQGLAQGDATLLGSDATALEHDEVLLHLSVVGEASHGVDGLVSNVVFGGSVVLNELVKENCIRNHVMAKKCR